MHTITNKVKRASVWAALTLSAGLSLSVPAVHAATNTTGQFNVNVTLTPKCEFFNGSSPTATIADLALSYISFQNTTSTGSTNFKVRCTNTLGYGLSLDAASVTDGTTGLQMVLALSGSSTHTATPTASLSGLSGNGNAGQTYYVHGTLAANQDGTVTPGAANNQRVLTITY